MIKNKAALFSIIITLLSVVFISGISNSYGQTEFLPKISMNRITAITANKVRQLQNKDDRDFVFQKAEKILKKKFPNAKYAEYWEKTHNGFFKKFTIDLMPGVMSGSVRSLEKLLTGLSETINGSLLVKWDGEFEIIEYNDWTNIGKIVYSDKWTNWFK